MNYKLIIYIIIFFIIGLIIRLNTNTTITCNKDYNLNDNGFTVIENILDENDINVINNYWNNKNYIELKHFINNHYNVKINILKKFPNYILQNYIFLIEKSKIHVCHRDGNAKIYNITQKYPSYTVIFYIDNMDYNLDVIPNSHKNNTTDIYITDTTKSIKCNKGDAILFDAGLVHCGSFNKKPNNKRIQMKLTHKDDIKDLDFYENYNKILDKENTNPEYITKIQKYLSCQFPFIGDLTSTEIKSDNVSGIKKIYSKIFYNNENYYNLPNII